MTNKARRVLQPLQFCKLGFFFFFFLPEKLSGLLQWLGFNGWNRHQQRTNRTLGSLFSDDLAPCFRACNEGAICGSGPQLKHFQVAVGNSRPKAVSSDEPAEAVHAPCHMMPPQPCSPASTGGAHVVTVARVGGASSIGQTWYDQWNPQSREE